MQQRNFLSIAILSLGALAIALVSQHIFDLRPCAWCVLQRLVLVVVFLLSVIGYLAARGQQSAIITLSRLALLISAWAGVLAAGYQHFVAAKLFSCDMSLADKLMTGSGLEAALPWLFGIYATCSDASINVLGIPYAIWAMLLFLLITLIAVRPLVNLGRLT